MSETYSAMNLFLDFCVIGILILGIFLFRWPDKAKYGNLTAALALALAAVLILVRSGMMHPYLLVIFLLIGSSVGYWVARKITMIQIPAMVAFQHGAGGVAAFFLSLAELMRGAQHLGMINEISGLLGLSIGALTFSGSMIAGGKLSNKLGQTPKILPNHTRLVLINLAVIIGLIIMALSVPFESRLFVHVLIILVSILFGIIFSIRIGGADMPVLISFLNATAGVAAAFCGMIIENKLLIACGATVAASGSILTYVMCKGMNRSLYRVFIPAEKPSHGNKAVPVVQKAGIGAVKPVIDKPPVEKDDFQKVIEYARNAENIIVVPGYGMAVAQAQFAVIELSNLLISMGKKVTFAIHPVAGRMPGHMNVLLAEAGIDYDLLKEMDEINPEFKETDLSLVVGACDVVNPAAIEVDGSPISGMPILHTHESRQVVCCNLDAKPGYSGVDNPLYTNSNTTLLLGSAKETIERLVEGLSAQSPDHSRDQDTESLAAENAADESSHLEKAVTALLSARKVIIIPGYGMALAQAQFKVVELSSILESMGKQVTFAIHPVAGRMPGHMNVLLAEAEVDYDKLLEMDDINPEFKETDAVIVFGACDVVNPAAMESEGTPISGMPILKAYEAKQVIICNFDDKPGYSGVENTLYQNENTIMMLGDAASTAKVLINAVKKADQ